MTTAYDSWPTVLCACGISLHDYPGSRAANEDRHHSTTSPAEYLALFDQSENGDLL